MKEIPTDVLYVHNKSPYKILLWSDYMEFFKIHLHNILQKIKNF